MYTYYILVYHITIDLFEQGPPEPEPMTVDEARKGLAAQQTHSTYKQIIEAISTFVFALYFVVFLKVIFGLEQHNNNNLQTERPGCSLPLQRQLRQR